MKNEQTPLEFFEAMFSEFEAVELGYRAYSRIQDELCKNPFTTEGFINETLDLKSKLMAEAEVLRTQKEKIMQEVERERAGIKGELHPHLRLFEIICR